MRCPYCGSTNSDRATYCVHCGRNMISQSTSRQQPAPPAPPAPPPYQQPRPAVPPQGGSTSAIPPVPRPNTPPPQPQSQRTRIRQPEPPPEPVAPAPVAPPAPEPPVPFPPHTFERLQGLESGALTFTVVDTREGDGHKKIVRIAYPNCVAWQQAATLLKALKEQQEERFDTIIIEGVRPQENSVYEFTNGQLRFDRNVRLGSQTTNRYQIDTGNGFDADSVRIVLTE